MLQSLRIFLVSGLLLLFAFSVSAQDQKDQHIGFGFRSAGISFGWYKPSMDYWNSTYFTGGTYDDPAGHVWENKFNGNVYYTGFLELNIIKSLRVKASGTYWTEKVKSGTITIGDVQGVEQLATSLTFVSLDVIYNPGFLTFEKFSPYVGVGGSFVFVQNKLTRSPQGSEEEVFTNQGQDITGTITAGIERTFGRHFAAAIDFRYLIGGYTQEMMDQKGAVTSHPVSLAGPMVGINLYYVLK